MACEEIFKAAKAQGISKRTVNEAKKSFDNIRSRKVGVKWMWSLEEKTPEAAALTEDETEETEAVTEESAEENMTVASELLAKDAFSE